MPTMRSPNELQKAAQDIMLEGREPVTREDWILIVNFWAANVCSFAQPEAIIFLGVIMGCPLTSEEIAEISNFQVAKQLEAQAQLN